MNKKKTNLLIVLTLIYLLIVFILFLIIFVIPAFQRNANLKTEVIKYGEVKVSIKKDALIIRNEKLYISSKNGKIVKSPTEGKKVRKGQGLFYIESKTNIPSESGIKNNVKNDILEKTKKISITNGNIANKTGVVSYWTDGNENNFKYSKIKNIKETDLEKEYEIYNLKEKYIKQGSPFYRLYDNSKFYFVFFASKKENQYKLFKKGQYLTVKQDYKNITGIIKNVYTSRNEQKVVVKSNMYYPAFEKERKLNLEFIFNEFSGLRIKKESVIKHGKQIGVYKKYLDDNIEFVPIKIIGEDDKNCIIASSKFYDDKGKEILTVNYYDEIVENAKDY